MRQKVKNVAILIVFCLLLPYVLAVVTGKTGQMESGFAQEGISVVVVSGSGRQKIPEKLYLTGAMAASIPGSMLDNMEEEMLKAQAVVLRTNLYAAYIREGDKSDRSVENDAVGQPFLNKQQMRSLWGEEYEAQYGKCFRAVERTRGEIMTYGGIPVNVPYFYVSAGVTRDGAQVLGAEGYPYLSSVECPQDMLCPQYSVKFTYSERVFWEKLDAFLNESKTDGDSESIQERQDAVGRKVNVLKTNGRNVSDFTLKRDSADYVLGVTDETTGHTYAGEALRTYLELPSSCFYWKQEKGNVEIIVKGQGHGIGMSQFGANELAKQGKNYTEILENFFYQMNLQKNE